MQLNRRTARETVMTALYALELSNDSLEHIIETVLKKRLSSDEQLLDFAEKLFLRTVRDKKQLDEIISGFVTNWDIKRIASIDRCVLRMGLAEMMTFEDIPTKVSINEAIDVVKKFSTHKSGNFVNGILDSASKKLIEEGKIKKQGSGLIDKTLPRDK